MKTLFLSSNKRSLQQLAGLSDGLALTDAPAFVCVEPSACLPSDALVAIKKEIELSAYDLFILADSDVDQELAAGIAISMKTGCSTKCTGIGIDGDALHVIREVFGGLANLHLVAAKKPYVLTVSKSYLNAVPPAETEMTFTTISVKPEHASVALLDSKRIEKTVDLVNAKKIVSIGRGIDKKENLPIIEALAKAMNAELGCSRPISEDFKWLPLERQVGLTGETVKPDMYLAVGISGQVQHLVGMRDAKVVIAINNNKSAPIFEFCDYGLVADLFEIAPLLTQRIQDQA